MLPNAFIITFMILYVCYECGGATVSSSSGKTSFTWNFILSDSQTASDFNGLEHTIDTSAAQAMGDSIFLEAQYPREFNLFHNVDTDSEETDVYWRKWTGTIPKDAIVAGYTDSNGGTDQPIYMGQAFQAPSADIVPVQIFLHSESVKIPYGGKVTSAKKWVQVMCARDSSIVTWVSKDDTDRYSVSSEEDCVIGGTHNEHVSTFFGRIKHDGATVIGKVLHSSKVMYFADDGKELSVNDYEILCYTKAVEHRKKLHEDPRMN